MRPTLPCLCPDCLCDLHVATHEYPYDECVWCRAGEHGAVLQPRGVVELNAIRDQCRTLEGS